MAHLHPDGRSLAWLATCVAVGIVVTGGNAASWSAPEQAWTSIAATGGLVGCVLYVCTGAGTAVWRGLGAVIAGQPDRRPASRP